MAFSSDEAKAHSQDREKQWVDVQIKGTGNDNNSSCALSLCRVASRPLLLHFPSLFFFFSLFSLLFSSSLPPCHDSIP